MNRPAAFTTEVDRIGEEEWNRCLARFDDANLYQTWCYGDVRWGARNVSRLVLRRDGTIVAMAQVFVARAPGIKAGVAHVRWGPVCQLAGPPIDPEVVGGMATALHDEYVKKRGLLLRVLPKGYVGTPRGETFAAAFGQYASRAFGRAESYRTIDVDLAAPLERIRKNLDQKWRNQLNAAERKGLAVSEDDSDTWFPRFRHLLQQMQARKGFQASSDIEQFQRMQRALPAGQKMKVIMCEGDGIALAGLIGTAMGDTGIYLFGATSEAGMRCKAGYLLQWRMIEWLKIRGVTHYDLGGINPERNPGVYHFKRGLGGSDNLYARPLVACESVASRLFDAAARGGGQRLREALKRVVYGSAQ